jgi:geranylgeranyl pyrophosphate synthase
LSFENRVTLYQERVAGVLDRTLPAEDVAPVRLHSAMRYAVLNGGKRIRPLLVYATGECLGVDPAQLDAPAAAIELVHAFSLVHDDLPAMDDDDLRRGKPTVHRQYDEATAILAADALQPLAFSVLAGAANIPTAVRAELVGRLADACGSLGMTGGQAIDLESEGGRFDRAHLEKMYAQKTGALIHAAVVSACLLDATADREQAEALDRFAREVGIAFQIRDDILDIEGETAVIGKPAGSDAGLAKATWPGLLGIEPARQRCDELFERATGRLACFGEAAEPLRWLAGFIVDRAH